MSHPPPLQHPYAFPVTTRGYECDHTRTVPIPVFFSYLEQCRWDWIADPAFGLVEAIHEGHFFVVHEQTLALRRRVGMGVPLVVRGMVHKAGRCTVDVRQDVTRVSDGATVAVARVRGVWIGPNRKMARLPARVREIADEGRRTGLALTETVVESEPVTHGGQSWFSPAPVLLPSCDVETGPPQTLGSPVFTQEIQVRPSDIDIFDHVNAATYLRFFDDTRKSLPLLGDDALWPSLRASLKYVSEARVHDVLVAKVWREEAPHAFGFVLEREGTPLCWARIDVHNG